MTGAGSQQKIKPKVANIIVQIARIWHAFLCWSGKGQSLRACTIRYPHEIAFTGKMDSELASKPDLVAKSRKKLQRTVFGERQ